jgi:hypothetical protein
VDWFERLRVGISGMDIGHDLLASFLAREFLFSSLCVLRFREAFGEFWVSSSYSRFRDYCCIPSGGKLPAGWFGDMYMDAIGV